MKSSPMISFILTTSKSDFKLPDATGFSKLLIVARGTIIGISLNEPVKPVIIIAELASLQPKSFL
ncbi:hypothetical protein D3C72_829830 [compost metagenome]